MSFDTIIIALIWGAISSYLMLRAVGSGLAIICSLHGLLMTRWKRLANKATPGQVSYGIILHQLLLAVSSGFLFGFLLTFGDNFMQQKFYINYRGSSGLLCGVAAAIVMIIFLRAFWRRLVLIWKITHVFDYAEKRQRTSVLKG